ncbi:allantoinase PuuE [Photobacterium sp. BZF1]|uniref:allantoinase PuuE n=1 Tax=Photobacterium sp. BZF1 TaxID=1904457 RepID=UPI00351C7F54
MNNDDALLSQIATLKPRDMAGYAGKPPHANWPNNAKLAVQFVLNFEEGGENCILHGDTHSETFLSEIAGAEAYPDRHMSIESLYEYGSRSGVWRIFNEFEKRQLPLTIFAITTALERNPAVTQAIIDNGYDVVCHGLKWIHHQNMPVVEEREHMAQALTRLEDMLGKPVVGWYTGRDSKHTRQLLAEHPSILFDSDYYGDDLPFWTTLDTPSGQKPHLVVPYTLDVNDMRFSSPYGFSHGEEFFQYLKDTFDCFYEEGESAPKMMSIGMHCRILGKPGRIQALKKFLDYIAGFDDIWVTTRTDIAKHWIANHPADKR